MPKAIISNALELMNRALGLAGSSTGSSETLLDDDNLTQVIDVARIVSRSRALAGTDGIFTALMLNTHGAGTTAESSVLDPYAPAGNAVAPFPDPVPQGFDFWIAFAAVAQSGGTAGNFTDGLFRLGLPSVFMGLGVDEAAAALGATIANPPMGFWDDLTGGVGRRENGELILSLGMRIRRGTTLLWDTNASAAVGAMLIMVCALVPSALGQDVVA